MVGCILCLAGRKLRFMGTARGGSLRKVDHTTPFHSMGGGGEHNEGKRTLGFSYNDLNYR